MSAFGFREAFGSLIEVRLPEEQTVKVVSLPALALLKLEAWRDRHHRAPGKDAYDLRLILLVIEMKTELEQGVRLMTALRNGFRAGR